MKKVLFATTALVAFAGAAAADVSVSGSAEMGIAGGDGVETTFFQSVDVRFSMTGETDNGLSFGATVDLEDATERQDTGPHLVDVAGEGADFNVFISGNFGTLTMGDTDGAFDWAMQEVNRGSPGSINDAETAHAGFNGNSGYDGDHNGQVLRYNYAISGIGFAVSAEIDETGTDDAIIGLGFTYSLDLGAGSLGFGLGYQTADHLVATDDAWGVSVSYASDMGLTATVNYSDIDDYEHMGLGVSYAFDAFTLHANWGEYDYDGGGDDSGFGLAAGYDLGGGASLLLGYGDSDNGDSDWSFGLAMSF